MLTEIEGLIWDDDERRVALGHLTLARMDLWEVGDRYIDVLDAESTEWCGYVEIVDAAEDDPRFLLIVDRVEIVPRARGNDIGLHAVARAIRTWGEDALVALTAFPPRASGPEGAAGGEALSRHWSRLGLSRVAGTVPPRLAGRTDSVALAGALAKLNDWRPPAPAGDPARDVVVRCATARSGHKVDTHVACAALLSGPLRSLHRAPNPAFRGSAARNPRGRADHRVGASDRPHGLLIRRSQVRILAGALRSPVNHNLLVDCL